MNRVNYIQNMLREGLNLVKQKSPDVEYVDELFAIFGGNPNVVNSEDIEMFYDNLNNKVITTYYPLLFYFGRCVLEWDVSDPRYVVVTVEGMNTTTELDFGFSTIVSIFGRNYTEDYERLTSGLEQLITSIDKLHP